jgi:hypothetical protein
MNLKHTLAAVLSSLPPRSAVEELVRLFHQIAIVYLRKKARTGQLNPSLFGMPVEDVAFDCIADLFKRHNDGTFAQLIRYYQTVDVNGLDDDALLSISRRLVFSKVNQELYRQYREIDPSLHKLIRSLKAAVLLTPGVSLESMYDECWITFTREPESHEMLPLMPPEILEPLTAALVAGNKRLKHLLGAVSVMFAGQQIYRCSFPLLSFARIIRNTYARLGHIPTTTEDESAVTPEEILQQLRVSVAAVEERMRSSYVDRGKLSAGAYALTMATVVDILEGEYIGTDGIGVSFYDCMTGHMNGLTHHEYATRYRTILEYLVKLSRTEFLNDIRRDL